AVASGTAHRTWPDPTSRRSRWQGSPPPPATLEPGCPESASWLQSWRRWSAGAVAVAPELVWSGRRRRTLEAGRPERASWLQSSKSKERPAAAAQGLDKRRRVLFIITLQSLPKVKSSVEVMSGGNLAALRGRQPQRPTTMPL